MDTIKNTCGDMIEESKIKAYYIKHGAARKTLADKIDCIAYNWYLTEQQAMELLNKWHKTI